MNNQVYRISLFHTIIRKIIPSVLVYASVSQASQYTKGVEDRIHEADAIVTGQAIMISELMLLLPQQAWLKQGLMSPMY